MAQIAFQPFYTAQDNAGKPLAFAKWYFYNTGTLTPAAVYSDDGLTTPLPNPVVADSAGRFPVIYLDDSKQYRAALLANATPPLPVGPAIKDADPVNIIGISPGSITAASLTNSNAGLAAITNKLVYSPSNVGAPYVGVGDRLRQIDGLLSEPVTTPTTKTIGAGGDFASLSLAWDWVTQRRVYSTLRFSFLAGGTTVTAYELRHPDIGRIFLQGQALTGAMPTNDDMTGTAATDIAFIKTRIPSWITLDVSGSDKHGLGIPEGIGGIDNLAFFPTTATRYSLALGEFQQAYQNAHGMSSVPMGNVAVYGGVWGIWAVGAYISNNSRLFLGGQKTDGLTPPGAPLGMVNSVYRGDANGVNKLELFAPSCQNGIFADNCTIYADQCYRIAGASGAVVGVGIFNKGGRIYANTGSFTQCEAISITTTGGFTNLYQSAATNCAALATFAGWDIYQGNPASNNALIGIASDAACNFSGMSFTNCSGAYLFRTGIGATATFLLANSVSLNVTTRVGLVDGGKGEGSLIGTYTGSAVVEAVSGGYITLTGSVAAITGATIPAMNTVRPDQSYIKV